MTNKEGVADADSGHETQANILPVSGIASLNLSAQEEQHPDVTALLIEHHADVNIPLKTDSNASFLRAARSGNIEKLQEYLKGSIDINYSNLNGLNALHLAAKEGHVHIVQELLKKGANVNAATKKGNTALHIASLAGQEEVAQILVKHGANPNVQSQNGFTPLYMAAQENHDGVVKFLLANGANQNIATEDGFTPLAVALQQGHDKVVAVLLENDAKGRVRLPALHIAAKKDDCKAADLLLQNDHDPDVTSKSGFTPLHIAAHYGNEKIATLLLEKNADVNFSAKHQITPLHVAAKWGKSNMVTLLVNKGAKIDASTRDGLTPLHCAARSGHDQVVDLLLEKGAPITAKTKNGLAPLHMASQGDHVDSARILLYHKAPVDDVTVDYLTALHVAAHCGHVRVAKLLLDRKADPNARALNGFTPLHIACKKNRIKVVELLLKHGASIEATTESGLTPLHVASFMGCMNIVIYLIQHGANPDVPTVRGETPLHLAARANQSDIIRILLRNGAHVDASAREQQTPLHIAARLGNVDIVGLLLQHGAAVDATTKDMYTALHIAAKEGQEEVASVLLDHGASLTATTKKGFTPLHLAAKYGNIKVARLLLQKDAPVDAQGKNGVTPLHVAAHYDHVNVALLLLDKGAFPHATAKNGYTPLHIAAKKNQMDIATTLLEYGAKPSAESKAGFTPLHLAAQEGHTDMTTLLIEHHADVNAPAKNGLSPLHLCAQEDKVNVAAVLVKNGAKIDPQTKAGYTPLHVACHFGQINMIRFLLQHGADVNATTSHGYTPLHQAAQQGHTLIINLLLEHKASPNTTTNQGQTALSIAQRLGYISVVETLKIVTETIVTTTTTTVTEEKYKVVAPETMQETFMSDSEDEGAEDAMLGDQSMHYMTTDELKALADDNTLAIDVTKDERGTDSSLIAPLTAEEDHLTPQHVVHQEATFSSTMATDNVDISRAPVHAGFLVSFMVDARGGAMRGCRHSGVRVIIPPRRAPMPMRITCRYLRKEKLAYPPPLMEGEACASRILEVGPSGAKFLGPVIIEVPHFASLRGREREITILRSDNGETWREHTLEASDDAVHDVFNESFEGEELTAREDLSTDRITRILTTDFPQYFAIISRIRQEVHVIGPEGGMVNSTVVPQVQAIFPEGALTKKIKVGLQAQPINPELVTKLLGNRVAVSPILTVEPRRRKFHKPITLTIPVPQAATKGMINQYSGDAPTLRLLCSITGGTTKAQWEDVTGSTPLTFVNDCVSFTTTVSARFWLIDCRQVNEATKFATELYREAIHVPFMAKFVVFAKRHDPLEAQLRVFCMTDDKEDKTLESQEHFTEVAKSRDVEVLESKLQYLEFAGNLVPVTKSGEQLSLTFQAFRENRLPFTIRVKDPHQEPMGRIAFMREPRVGRGEPPQMPICNLNIVLPEADPTPASELVTLEKKYGFVRETSLAKPELIHRADLRISDIAKELREDWVLLALQLDMSESDINTVRSENPNDTTQQAHNMLRQWLQKAGSKATGNSLEKGLRKINREDIVNKCMFNVELVTDDVEKAVAKVHLDQSGFETFKEELGSSRDASLRRDTSLNGTYDEQDIMKDAESAAETSSESSDRDAHFRSDSRHPEKAERTMVTESVTRTSAKTFAETPETLVQSIPTALAESFTQHISNGQVSESSVHEDRSEPTATTLSSEATAEMDVSSLEDKSQAETHVENKEPLRKTWTAKYYQQSNVRPKPVKDTLKNIKMYKYKKTSQSDSSKNQLNFYARSKTPPATFRKPRMISRRNSWPPVLPLKFSKKKKQQQHIRLRDFNEPFCMDSMEWLTMKCAPEKYKLAPLAHLTEFDEVPARGSTYDKSKTSQFRKSCRVPYVHELTKKDKISFYFVNDDRFKNILSKKRDLISTKKQNYRDLKSCSVRGLKPTNFNHVLSNTENKTAPKTSISNSKAHLEYDTVRRKNNISNSSNASVNTDIFSNANIKSVAKNSRLKTDLENEPIIERHSQISHSTNASVITDILSDAGNKTTLKSSNSKSNLEQDTITERDIYHSSNASVNTDISFTPRSTSFYDDVLLDYYRQSFRQETGDHSYSLPRTSPHPLRSFDINESFGTVLICNGAPHIENHIVKQKIIIKDNCKNKENIKIPCFDSNFMHFEKHRKVSSPVRKSQKLNSNIVPNKNKHFSNRTAFQNSRLLEKNSFSFPKVDLTKCGTKRNDSSPQDMEETNASEDKSKSAPISSTPKASGSNVASIDRVAPDRENVSSTSGSSGQGSKDYMRELFSQDIQSNYSKSSKSKTDDGKDKDESNEEAKEMNDATEKVKSQENIPASVLGQYFLKCLQNQIDEAPKSPNIPASVIGQAFLKTLLDQSSEVVKENVIPAAVIGQSFLKNLMSSETQPSIPPSTPSKQSTTSEVEGREKNIPASVLCQTFLKTLVENKPLDQDDKTTVPSSEEPKTNVIPAPVVGQAFLKDLLVASSSNSNAPQQASEPIPSSVVGQTFLKSLLEQSSVENYAESNVIPASVVGQSFLKNLLESSASLERASKSGPTETNNENVIPASVVGQAFLKNLVEGSVIENVSNPNPEIIPAPVIGQSFLKSLIEQSPPVGESESNIIPAAVVSQAFLKNLVTASNEAETIKTIPAPVIGQSFLKTLIEQVPEETVSHSDVIPAPVVGQTFLKSLLETSSLQSSFETPEIEKSGESKKSDSSSVLPASVIGQTFLKSLIEEQSPTEECKSTIPSSVLGQVFLKSLAEASVSESTKDTPVPASAIGQTFLKSLLAESQKSDKIEGTESASSVSQSEKEKTGESHDPPIPSSVISQAFVKTLIEASNISESPKEQIPSSVVSQVFLKTLLEESNLASQSEQPDTSADDSKSVSSSQNVIPASVLGQTFLSSLLSQAPQPEPQAKETIPASVVGSAFLKTLTEQAQAVKRESPKAECSTKSHDKPIPANVVGQAFLKTLFGMSSDLPPEMPTETSSASVDSRELEQHEGSNGFSSESCLNVQPSSSANICSSLSSDEQSNIIPPPPEFRSEEGSAVASGSKIELPKSIIEELLSCTKDMQSVIEKNLKGSESRSSETVSPMSKEVCLKKDNET